MTMLLYVTVGQHTRSTCEWHVVGKLRHVVSMSVSDVYCSSVNDHVSFALNVILPHLL